MNTMAKPVNLAFTAQTLDDFLSWASVATYGEFCLYHEGHLAADRLTNKPLDNIADVVLLLAGTSYLIPSQTFIDVERGKSYIATRSGYGYAPRGVMLKEISARDYYIMCEIMAGSNGRSMTRVVRDASATSSDAQANAILKKFEQAGWVERGNQSWGLTREGRRVIL